MKTQTQTEALMESVNQLAEALKQCSAIAQKSVDQVDYYAQVAQAAIEVLGVTHAHLLGNFQSQADKDRFAADLQARGLPSPDGMAKLLGKIARKEF